jgi:poly(A) polymerase
MPLYVERYAANGGLSPPSEGADPAGPAGVFWRFLAAVDAYTVETGQPATNGVLLAVVLAPLLGESIGLSRDAFGRAIDDVMTPVATAMGIARRDRELARQILIGHRRMIDPHTRRRAPSLPRRQYFHEALLFLGFWVHAYGRGGGELRSWKELVRGPQDAPEPGGTARPEGRRRRRRRRRPAAGARTDHAGSGGPEP